MGRALLKVIKSNCKSEDASDTSLPNNAFLVTYNDGDEVKHDLVMSSKQSEIFDYYWDLYRNNFITMKQSEGRKSPKLWKDPNVKTKKKEK